MIFLFVFFWAYLSLKKKIALFDIGLGYLTVDLLVMILSIISILFAIYEIVKVEHARDYEEKIRSSL